jgi:hypothetical protein
MIYDSTDKVARTEREKNRNALLIVAVIVFALIAGAMIALPNQPADMTQPTPGPTASNTFDTTTDTTTAVTTDGTTESTLAPAAGDTNTTMDNTTITTPTRTYATEEECRGAAAGACHPVSGGWEAVTPTDNTSVPEVVAPPLNSTPSTTTP